MSVLISTENLKKTFGLKELYANLNFSIASGQKTALIGVNGCGKSTLLKILAGKEIPDEGRVTRNAQCRAVYSEQMPSCLPGQSIMDFILAGDGDLLKLVRDYEKCIHDTEHADDDATHLELASRLDDLTSAMESRGGFGLESRIRSILAGFGIDDPELLMENQSGGTIKKAALCKALVSDCNVLFLDEPTNHLDMPSIVKLQNIVRGLDMAVVLVTHDRYFLDEVCNQIIEIDEGRGKVYNGNFTWYLEKKAEMTEMESRVQDKLANTLRNELTWIRRGAKARTTKQKARIDRFVELNSRVKKVADPLGDMSSFASSEERLGGKIVHLEDVSYSWDGENVVIQPFSYHFRKGERLGIVGPNGSGKSTLLGLIASRLKPLTGEVDVGVNTRLGYFDQHSSDLKADETVIEHMTNVAKEIKLPDGTTQPVTRYLERFRFPTAMFNTKIGKLSGGEQKRLYLIKLLTQNPNFLILDEPTNDLDIPTLSLLEEYLTEFTGCLVIVSHDRFFLDRIAEKLLVIRPGGNVAAYPGSCSEYLDDLLAGVFSEKSDNQSQQKKVSSLNQVPTKITKEVTSKVVENQTQVAKKSGSGNKGLSYKEQKEFEALEKEITALEADKKNLEVYFSGPTDPATLIEKTSQYEKINAAITKANVRWEVLAEKMI